MPLYLKSHSQGEYVFDHAWADAYERAGGRYYPKLLCAAPFSPVTGPRLLVRPDVDRDEARRVLLGGALTLCEQIGASSLHVTFPTEDEWRLHGRAGPAAARRTSSTTGTTTATRPSTTSWPPCRPAAARPSGASAATPAQGWRSSA